MALQAHLAVGSVFNVPRFPAAGMGIGFATGVTLDTHIAFGVAGLARLQVPARLDGMLADSPGGCLSIRSQHQVRLDAQ